MTKILLTILQHSTLKKHLLLKIGLLSISLVLVSWGKTGHNKISSEASRSYNTEMAQFIAWNSTLALHASDADNRKNADPAEGPKHYIDLDNYPEFMTNGRIPQTLDSVSLVHDIYFATQNGTLPWATLVTFDSLRNCFARQDWNKAVLFAADLGHYVADGHMPMHITSNYDGGSTGNNGIHSRYETKMIDPNIGQINYTGMEIAAIPNVNQYIFNYLYKNYSYVDSVIAADNYAKRVSGGNTYSPAYLSALWKKSQGFTIPLFKNASHALAELIYTAWDQAGKPSMLHTSIATPDAVKTCSLGQNVPNPFKHSTTINYSLTKPASFMLQVKDMTGKTVTTILNENRPSGNYAVDWSPENIPGGTYYLVMKTGNFTEVQKMVLVR